MYVANDWGESSCYKCPSCGRFVSPEDGFYDREARHDEFSLVLAFCNEDCADSWHDKKPMLQGI